MVKERTEDPKALSPEQHPGYTRSQECALKGQKLYITFFATDNHPYILRDWFIRVPEAYTPVLQQTLYQPSNQINPGLFLHKQNCHAKTLS